MLLTTEPRDIIFGKLKVLSFSIGLDKLGKRVGLPVKIIPKV